MTTSLQIMTRRWAFPDLLYRAINKDGDDVYSNVRPSLGFWTWVINTPDGTQQTAGNVCVDWSVINWENSLQTIKDGHITTV
jgi:hypothetical protein